MLNRKRTHNIMVGKYLMFIPVVALLLLFSNCANKKTDKAQSDTEKADTVVAVEPEKKAEPQAEATLPQEKDVYKRQSMMYPVVPFALPESAKMTNMPHTKEIDRGV